MKKIDHLTLFSGVFIACAVITAILAAAKSNITCTVWAILAASYCWESLRSLRLLNEFDKLNEQLLETGSDLADKLQAALKTIEQLQADNKRLRNTNTKEK